MSQPGLFTENIYHETCTNVSLDKLDGNNLYKKSSVVHSFLQ